MRDPTPGEIVLAFMRDLRADGWCVVLKCQPATNAWIVAGDPSEYGAGGPNTGIGAGKWVCEVQDVANLPGQPWRHSQWAMHERPEEAVRLVVQAVHRDAERRRAERMGADTPPRASR